MTSTPASTSSKPTAPPSGSPTPIRYGHAVSLTLVAAFTLSVVHTGYAWRAGLEDPDFTVDTPLTWVFYAVGFTAAALARRSSRRIELALVGYLTAMLAIGVFYYPTTFTSEKQTTFGWFENDVYLALLGLALFLSVTRLLQRPLVP